MSERLNELLPALHARLEELVLRYQNPAVLCSFGKDSLALLEGLVEIGAAEDSLPVIHFTDPWYPESGAYAWREIWWRGLQVFSWMPAAARLAETRGKLETVALYGIQPGHHLAVPRDVVELEEDQVLKDGERYVCAVNWITQPTCGLVKLPFDGLIVGHKDADVDPVRGPIPLAAERVEWAPGLWAEFPLKDWTDADVTAYLRQRGVKMDLGRYWLDETEGVPVYRSRPEPQVNPDYQRVCRRCACDGAGKVWCPRVGRDIERLDEDGRKAFYLPAGWEPEYYGRDGATS